MTDSASRSSETLRNPERRSVAAFVETGRLSCEAYGIDPQHRMDRTLRRLDRESWLLAEAEGSAELERLLQAKAADPVDGHEQH